MVLPATTTSIDDATVVASETSSHPSAGGPATPTTYGTPTRRARCNRLPSVLSMYVDTLVAFSPVKEEFITQMKKYMGVGCAYLVGRMRCVLMGRHATEVTGVCVLHNVCLCQNVHASDKAYTCCNTTWTCWAKYHRYYLPKKLFSRTGKVRTRSDLYKLKRSLLATENEEDPSAGSKVGVADARSVVCTIAL
ncbi:LOW QUALITY PROTEIN: hypothetical protein PHMEG_00016835 [Phytophthora megakarya]|uniref:Uncharacterized protein n=1 Tax=Phytophthora megakarya TaxID=4795 RepID=A0A225VXZ4_9STRA|nr:LOW QUALITY PROTEIN: hypothetical protein PHMEG_00016835 [Phytophthora megakarya]